MLFVESESVELKSRMTDGICKEIIAFANTNGGTLYIGVEDDGAVIGLEDADFVLLQISHKVKDSIKPDVTMFVHYEIMSIDANHILSVTVQKGSGRPYYLAAKGLKPAGVFVRNGTSCDPATDTMIRQMIKDYDGDSYESMRSLDQSLTFRSVINQFESRHIPFKMQSLGFLSQDGVFSNVAMLLSDQCCSTIKAAVFSGSDKSNFQDRREFSGSLFQQMEDLYTYLDLNNQTKATINGLYRQDVTDYPKEALREVLLNCLIHRDYSFSASTLISIYDDRIEFVSIGGLPNGINLDDIMLGISLCRNPKLAAVFYRLELIEAYGTGIPKIMNAYKDAPVKPKIEATNNAFKITLPNRNYVSSSSYDNESAYCYETRVLDFINEHGMAVRSDVDDLLGISQSTSSRILKKMIDNNQIYSEGKGKGIKYKKR